MTSLLLLAVLATPHRHRPAPHLLRPADHPALHKRFGWIHIHTRTWSGKQYVDLGMLARYRWIMEANGR